MHYITIVSDATGKTAERVVKAALTQFPEAEVSLSRHGEVLEPVKIRPVVEEAARNGGFIVHTFVSQELRRRILTEGRKQNVVTIDLMGPLLSRLTEMLARPPRAEPGLFRPFDDAYLDRIEAIDFTVRHDDGLNAHELDQAEIVLTGISRTSKTPVSIYLSYRGWRVANVPIALGVEPPPQLFKLPRRRVVAFTIQPDRLSAVRKERARHLHTRSQGYADIEHIRKELAYAYTLFDRRKDWPLIDVTSKPVEETAEEVLALINPGNKKTISSGSF
jgi:regulator of PEP synthase PpsR (kinase-PPPase family)